MQTLLLADHDSARAQQLAQTLPSYGFAVTASDGGVDCVAKLRQILPDVLVLDVELLWGGFDGVLAYLREEHPRLSLPLVLVVGDCSPAFLGRLRWLPGVRRISQPFRFQRLLTALYELTICKRDQRLLHVEA